MAKTSITAPEWEALVAKAQWQCFIRTPEGKRFLREMRAFYRKWAWLYE